MNDVETIQWVSANKSIGKRNNGKYILFDHTVSVNPPHTQDFDYMSVREDGRIDIKINDSWGMMDILGRILVFPCFSSPLVFEDGLCIVQESQYDLGHLGVIEYNGTELVPTIYYRIMLEEENILNMELGFYEYKVVFIFGCNDDSDYIPYVGCNGGYIAHLREDFGVDLYLRNGKVFMGKYECFYVTYDRQYIFAGYKGFKVIGYDGDRNEYLKRYVGYHELINKEGVVLLNRITDFIYYRSIKAVRLGFEDTKWAFLNSDNDFVTRKGSIVSIEEFKLLEKNQDIFWPMTSDEEINNNFELLNKIYDCEEIGHMIDEMKKKTIWMTDEEYEDDPYPNFEHDPYQYIKNNKKDDYSIMDALDGEPDAYWNID